MKLLIALTLTLTIFLPLKSIAITNGMKGENPHPPVWLVKIDLCSGAIINKRFILTAAHCVFEKPPNLIRLRAYKNVLIKDLPILGKVKRVISHEDYMPWSASGLKLNDIALIELKEDLVFSSSINKVNLPTHTQSPEDINQSTDLYLGGYGRLADGSYPKELHYLTNLKLIPESSSNYWLDPINQKKLVSDDVEFDFLTTYFVGKYIGVEVIDHKSACRGDSGSPLVETNSNTIYGVVSLGQQDCINQPVFFLTDVSSYIDWINEHTLIK